MSSICWRCGKPCDDDVAYCDECSSAMEQCVACGVWDHKSNLERWVRGGFVEWWHPECMECDD